MEIKIYIFNLENYQSFFIYSFEIYIYIYMITLFQNLIFSFLFSKKVRKKNEIIKYHS